MHARNANNILQPLELPHDERPMRPGTRVRDVEMVPVLLGRELCVGLVLDEVTEHRGLALEFAALVVGQDPIEDVFGGLDQPSDRYTVH